MTDKKNKGKPPIKKVTIYRDPFAIVIEDLFGSKITNKFLAEFTSLKSKFTDAAIAAGGAGGNSVNKEVRSNTVLYYDTFFQNRRSESVLLRETEGFIGSDWIKELLSCTNYPINLYNNTNYHETQVSRYGDSDQKYDWHIDRLGNSDTRLITFSYYVSQIPKKFSGGEIILSNGLLANHSIYGESNRHVFEVKNDMLVIFDSRTPHCVMPTISPKRFQDGRFSIQMWIGYVQK